LLVLLTLAAAGGDDAALTAGVATVHDAGPNAFTYAAPVLTPIERRAFAVGNAFFKDNWVTAPASTAGRDGLGPLFNARSCSTCHHRDGRGRPPRPGEVAGNEGLLLRIGVAGDGADLPHPRYGDQVQDQAVLGVRPEALVVVGGEEVPGTFADGTPYTLRAPSYRLEELGYGPLGEDVRLGPRVAPHLVGLGLLEAVPVEAVLALADPDDADGDGVSGRPHWVVGRRSGERELGRFGWKATQPTVEEQVATAFVNDIGITSPLLPDEATRPDQAIEAASGGTPELSGQKLARVVFYSQVLGVPAARDVDDPRVRAGRVTFTELGCATCHTPELTTGPQACLPALAGQRIRPFTDLLLHDMGPGLADGKRDGDAQPGEWRTPPLWGIGLIEVVSGHGRLLHDGRARNMEEAVLWHGGEGARARERYRALSAEQREELLAFLRSI